MSKKPKSGSFKKARRRVYIRDNFTCGFCGLVMNPAHPLLTIEHLVPIKYGGKHKQENLRTCCWYCNQKRNGAKKMGNPPVNREIDKTLYSLLKESI